MNTLEWLYNDYLVEILIGFTLLLWALYKCRGVGSSHSRREFNHMYGGDFETIADHFTSLEDVSKAVRKAGLESCNLIFGVDYTMSNLTQGEITCAGKSLHHLDGNSLNPYQQVIKILGETLASFDEDNIIPAFGFGDLSTKDRTVNSLSPEGYCQGFDGVLEAYNRVTPLIKLSGPTSFAPIIYRAIEIVKQTLSFHILVIVADGQVTSERATVEAIVEASHYPLSIVMVGVGDGPWNEMKHFDDKLPQRQFDNFQFVDFHKILSSRSTYKNPEAAFALQALMELPYQYRIIRDLGMFD